MIDLRQDREAEGRGRVEWLRRLRPAAVLVVAGWAMASVVLLGVHEVHAGSPRAKLSKRSTFEQVWKHYRSLPDLRAIAIAGDIRTSRWVSGIVAGARTRESAAAQAIEECRRQRHAARMRAPCLLFAEGEERVADRPPEE